MSSQTRPRPILAVDMGTTNTRAAYMMNTQVEESKLLQGDLDTGRIQDIRFDRTAQVYAKTDLAWNKNTWIWGNDVDDAISNYEVKESHRFKMIKLGLENSSYTESIREDLNSQISRLPKAANVRVVDDLITIYLRLFITEVMAKLNDRHRELANVDRFKLSDIDTIICVPAAWDFLQRHRMQDIAKNAGLLNVHFPVSESDAAALFLKYDEPRQLGALQAEEDPTAPFLVMDGGGGTYVRCFTPTSTFAYRDRMLQPSFIKKAR